LLNSAAALAVNPWDFPLDTISIPIYLWQGEEDHNFSIAAGRYFARTIPDCRAIFLLGEGYLSIVVNHLKEIFKTLIS
jgi:poly(3-hydroxyalkanoate) synthetase